MSSAIFTFVINAAWQGALISIAALLLTRVVRRATVCTFAIALCLVVSVASVATGPRPVQAGRGPATTLSRSIPSAVAVSVAIAELLVIAYGLASLAIRLRRTRRLVAESRLIGFAGEAELRVADVTVPSTAGSVILLPEYILGTPALLDAAIAHELAHVRRRDYFANILLELISIPLLLHPGVVALRRRATELREMSCDRVAAAEQGQRNYAQALVAIANLAAGKRSLVMSMANSTVLERRLDALRTSTRTPPLATFCIAVAVPMLLTISCRYSVQPSVGEKLNGVWTLAPEASRFGPLKPYTSYRKRIEANGNIVRVSQQRKSSRGVENIAWSVRTDGVTRPVSGVPGAMGSARWYGDRLAVELKSGTHYERATAFIERGSLVVDGELQDPGARGSFRFVFRREK
jgi:hypothetical protein